MSGKGEMEQRRANIITMRAHKMPIDAQCAKLGISRKTYERDVSIINQELRERIRERKDEIISETFNSIDGRITALYSNLNKTDKINEKRNIYELIHKMEMDKIILVIGKEQTQVNILNKMEFNPVKEAFDNAVRTVIARRKIRDSEGSEEQPAE